LVLSATAGNITATVQAGGKAGANPGGGSDGKYDSRKFKFVERIDYKELHDFVVYIDGPIAGFTNAPKNF